MSIPKHKMLTASKSIMAVASVKRDVQRSMQHQKQVVNVNIQNASPTVAYPTESVRPDKVYPKPDKPYEYDEGITVVPPTIPKEPEKREVQETNPYADIDELQFIIKNNETAVRALIMIIDILQSNPLIINKLVVAYDDAFKELIKLLTSADDVDIQYVDEVSCFASSKYKLIDDVYVISGNESISLKYGFPDVMRLFDRFKISTKMIAI